jgi:hypothetical protein
VFKWIPPKLRRCAWPVPTTVTQLHAFLGLSGYYRRFIKNYATIARPLTELLQKDGFVWNDNTQTAFEALKSTLLYALALSLPKFFKPLFWKLMLLAWV